MYGFAKSHPEGLATRTKLRLLSERPSQAQGPQSSARRRSTRNPLPSSDKSAGRILKCPKDGALSSSPASPPSPACTRRDVPHRGRVYPGCCGLTTASPTSCSPNQDAGQDQDARRLAGLQSPSQETAELDAVHCLLPVGPLQHARTPTHVGTPATSTPAIAALKTGIECPYARWSVTPVMSSSCPIMMLHRP